MTLNGVIALLLRFFSPNSIALQAYYVTVVEETYNVGEYSPRSSLPLLAKTNAPCSSVSLRLLSILSLTSSQQNNKNLR